MTSVLSALAARIQVSRVRTASIAFKARPSSSQLTRLIVSLVGAEEPLLMDPASAESVPVTNGPRELGRHT